MNAGLGAGSLIAAATVSVSRPTSFHVVYAVDGPRPRCSHSSSSPGCGHDGLVGARRPRPRGTNTRYRTVLQDRPFVAYLGVLLALAVFGSAQLQVRGRRSSPAPGGSAQVVGLGFAANTVAIIALQLRWNAGSRGLRRSGCSSRARSAGPCLGAHRSGRVPGDVRDRVGGPGGVGPGGVRRRGDLPQPGHQRRPERTGTDHLRGRYNALNSATYPVSKLIGPPLAGVLIGSGVPSSWVVTFTLGLLLTAVGAGLLGRRLPSPVEFPRRHLSR